MSLAGGEIDSMLDGTNLIPHLSGETAKPPHEYLFFRFLDQSAVIKNNWKYIKCADGATALYDLSAKKPEVKNVADEHPEITAELQQALGAWLQGLKPKGEISLKKDWCDL